MRKKRTVLLACACTSAAIGLLLFALREPGYKGHGLTYWLRAYAADQLVYGVPKEEFPGITADEAEKAVRQIGPKALPHLIRWVTYQESGTSRRLSAWRRRLATRRLGNYLSWLQPSGLDLTPFDKGLLGFAILRTSAGAAAPKLARLAAAEHDPRIAQNILSCLYCIGPDAIPTIADLVTNRNTPTTLRQNAISMTGGMGSNATGAVPALLTNLCDADPWIVCASIQALDHIGPPPNQALPTLARLTRNPSRDVRCLSLYLLGKLGPAARSELPQLRTALIDPDASAREAATNALQKIAPEVLTNAPAQ